MLTTYLIYMCIPFSVYVFVCVSVCGYVCVCGCVCRVVFESQHFTALSALLNHLNKAPVILRSIIFF